jgi:hypothetical protein
VTDNASVVPPVVALVIVERPQDGLDETLAALVRQDAGALRVLVMDATADGSVTARAEELAPGAIVRRAGSRTFVGAANEAAALVAGSGFLCVLAAGTSPEPSALRMMLEEAFRSNAGVVGPKFVDQAAPNRLESVGYGADKFAEVWLPAAPGELDQEQHDAVVDRFTLSSRCLMIRSDLFTAIGGFDATLSTKVAEIDLCWRAHASGARVLVVPDARTRTAPELREPDDARRDATERLGVVFSNYSPGHLVRVVPQAFVVTLLSAIANLITLRPARAAARLISWPGALGRLGHIRSRRRSFAQLRKVPDAEIRRLQQRGSARLGIFLRGRRSERRIAAMVGETSRTWFDDVRAGIHWPSAVAWVVVLGMFLLGSRNLITARVPAMSGLPGFPARASDALGSYLSGWRPGGLGHVGSAPTGLGVVGLLGTVLLGKMGLARAVATIGLMLVGYIGIWHAARPFRNERARLAALLVYAIVPLAPNALAGGRWGGLAAYAAAPFVFGWLAAMAGVAPWAGGPGHHTTEAERVLAEALALESSTAPGNVTDDSADGSFAEDGEAVADLSPDRLAATTARLAVVSALVAAVAPAWFVAVAVLSVALAIGALLGRRVRAARRVLASAVVAIVVAAILHLPWALGGHAFLAGFNRRGLGAAVARTADLLRFRTGPHDVGVVGWFVIPAAFAGLAFAMRNRLATMVRLGIVALAGVGAAWAVEHRRLPGVETEVVLVIALAAVALAAATSVDAFDRDVRGHRLSWRQPLGFLAAFAMLAALVAAIGAAGDGAWKTRDVIAADSVKQVIGQRVDGANVDGASTTDPSQFRVLWLGDALALPTSGFTVSPGVSAALTSGTDAFFDDRWGIEAGRGEATIASGLLLAADGSTSRLGLVLAPAAVRYVVVPRVRADGSPAVLPAGLERVFDTQLDLRRIITGDERIVIFQNESWLPERSQLSPSAQDASTRQGVTELVAADLSGSTAVLQSSGQAEWRGPVAAGDIFVATRNEPGWSLTVDGSAATRRPAFGWAQAFTAVAPGEATLRYKTPLYRRLLILLQILGVVLVGSFAIRGRGVSLRRAPRLAATDAGAHVDVADDAVAIQFDDIDVESSGAAAPSTGETLVDEPLESEPSDSEDRSDHLLPADNDDDEPMSDPERQLDELEPTWQVASDRDDEPGSFDPDEGDAKPDWKGLSQ